MELIHKRHKRTHVLNRREFLQGIGSLTALAIAAQGPADAQGDPKSIPFPFTLGVASGDPWADGVVLWTRLAPQPLTGGGMPSRRFAVQWFVAADPGMQQIVQRGSALAIPELAHSVHVELHGLQPGREYWYRFQVGNHLSPIARTKTAPLPNANNALLKFGFVSCNDWQNGYFAAFQRLAEEPNLDVILHLGDYIYEYGPQSTLPGRLHTTPEAGPSSSQLTTLSDYRNRHAQYKTDPALQAAHHAAPWILTWDDHEVENNYANDIDEEVGTPPATFLLERAAAYQAYYEHQPLRITSLPQGPNAQIYRRLTYGRLAELSVLDTRQYRTDQPQGDGFRPTLPANGNPTGTLMGDVQEAWLYEGLSRSQTRWNVIAQQIMMAQFNFGAFLPPQLGGPPLYNMDQWDGYGANRQRLLNFFETRLPANFVVLSGDIHSAWAFDLKKDFFQRTSRTVATEFVCTSITSDFPAALVPAVAGAASITPYCKFFDGARRGYVVCTLTPQQYQADFKAVAVNATGQVANPNAPVATLASFVVENGTPGARRI